MPTLAETQFNELSAWLTASSQDSRSPMGYTILRSPYAEFVTVTLDDVLPDLSATIALSCLPLLTTQDVPAAAFADPEGLPLLSDRAAHLAWLSTAQRDGFPACAVVSVAEGQTLRQAAVSAGDYFDNPDALLVGIPDACFCKKLKINAAH